MVQHEAALCSHQKFYEAYSKANMWLRVANDKLAECNDARTDKEQLEAKIERLQVIKMSNEPCAQFLFKDARFFEV
jgi:hypothetical protein